MTNPWFVVDIETTGLDFKKDRICEVYMSQVNPLSMKLGLRSYVGMAYGDGQARMLKRRNTEGNRIVNDMHTKSGLIEDLEKLSAWEEEQGLLSSTEKDLARDIRKYIDNEAAGQNIILIGSSVHFDRQFLIQRLGLEDLFFHRVIDVSSFKEVVRHAAPDLLASVPEPQKLHRALPDALDTLEELNHYRQAFTLWNDNRAAQADAPIGKHALVTHSTSRFCSECENAINAMTYQGTGVCSVNCYKARERRMGLTPA